MQRTKHVEVTSSQEKQGIVNTSVQAMNTRVVGQAAEMKKRFVAPITNDEGRPSATRVIDRVVKQTEEALDEIAGMVSSLTSLRLPYTLEVLSTDNVWEQVGEKWQVRIAQTTHNFTTIHSVIAERRMSNDMYENMVYTYKRYKSGSVAVILDSKIDMRIIIKGSTAADENAVIKDTQLANVRFDVDVTTGKLHVTYPDDYDVTTFDVTDGRLYATTKEGYAKPNLYIEDSNLIYEN